MENRLLALRTDYFHPYVHTHALSLSLSLSLYHCNLIFMAIILAFSPMHLLEVMLCQEESHPFQILFIPPTDLKGVVFFVFVFLRGGIYI